MSRRPRRSKKRRECRRRRSKEERRRRKKRKYMYDSKERKYIYQPCTTSSEQEYNCSLTPPHPNQMWCTTSMGKKEKKNRMNK